MTYGDILFPGEDLKSPITISGANKFLRRIKDSLGFGEFTSHDFRRTLATRLSEEGVAPHVIEKCWGMSWAACFLSITSMTGLPNRKTPMICMLKRYFGISGRFLVDTPFKIHSTIAERRYCLGRSGPAWGNYSARCISGWSRVKILGSSASPLPRQSFQCLPYYSPHTTSVPRQWHHTSYIRLTTSRL